MIDDKEFYSAQEVEDAVNTGTALLVWNVYGLMDMGHIRADLSQGDIRFCR